MFYQRTPAMNLSPSTFISSLCPAAARQLSAIERPNPLPFSLPLDSSPFTKGSLSFEASLIFWSVRLVIVKPSLPISISTRVLALAYLATFPIRFLVACSRSSLSLFTLPSPLISTFISSLAKSSSAASWIFRRTSLDAGTTTSYI